MYCPHCQTVYPLVDRLIGSPVRCRQCRKGFIVDENGVARPLITNKPPADKPTDSGTSDDDIPLDISGHAVDRPDRPATRRLTRSGDQPQRKRTSRIMAGMSPNGANGIGALRAALNDKPSVDASANDSLYTPPQQSPPLRRASTGKRHKTELIMNALREGVLNSSRVNPAIAAAVDEREDRDDLGNESTSFITKEKPSGQDDDAEKETGPRVKCPHCQAEYPYMDTLCDRLIRCRSCAGVFKVFPMPVLSQPLLIARCRIYHWIRCSTSSLKRRRTRSHVIRNRDLIKAMSGNMAKMAEGVPAEKAPMPTRSRDEAVHERVGARGLA